jgi:hypothetical protein
MLKIGETDDDLPADRRVSSFAHTSGLHRLWHALTMCLSFDHRVHGVDERVGDLPLVERTAAALTEWLGPTAFMRTNPRGQLDEYRILLTRGQVNRTSWKPVHYATAGGPNHVASASASPGWIRSPTQATYPSGRTRTAVGAATAPIAGRSHVPTYLASIN